MKDIELRDTLTEESTKAQDSLLGQTIPDFIVAATNNFDIHLTQLQGFQTLICFYPQNGLPDVTQLMKDLAAHYNGFKEVQTCIFGVSNESLDANQAFKDSLDLPFQLIADTNLELANWFQTATERTLFGDPIKTLEQSTFLIDGAGKIQKIWRNPEIKGHAVEALETAHRLAQGLTETPLLNEDPSDALGEGKGQEKLAAELAEIFEI